MISRISTTLRKQRRYVISSLFLLAIFTSLASLPKISAAVFASFSGQWKTNYGTMFLRQGGDGKVTGQYNNGGTIGDIDGSVSNNVLTGTWTENQGNGQIKFVLANDGSSFTGSWNRAAGKGEPGGSWNGHRTQ